MTDRINVLDHGFVGLVDHMGDDLSIVRNARVSFDAQWRAGEDKGSDARLINYMFNNRHTTPFEGVTFTFDVKAPIFVLRQWHRHRTQSYNELSARYRELPTEYYIPEPWLIGVQSETDKQAREILTKEVYESLPSVEKAEVEKVRTDMWLQIEASFTTYNSFLERGVPRELARSVLPVATYSHMFTTMNLHNLFHFLGLRLDAHAQYEIRVYAEAMLELIEPIVPIAVAAFKEHTP